jgi:hypothetical protein
VNIYIYTKGCRRRTSLPFTLVLLSDFARLAGASETKTATLLGVSRATVSNVGMHESWEDNIVKGKSE